MRWTILSVAYPLAPVRPDTAGGAEQILAALDSGLTAAGHQSLVVACEGSETEGILLASPLPHSVLNEQAIARARENHCETVEEGLRRWKVDLVHMHGLDFGRYLPRPGVPVLITLHLPVSWYDPRVLRTDRPDTHFNCVSDWQRKSSAALLPGGCHVIENGVAIGRRDLGLRKRDFVLALGRICPEKAFHVSLDAARQAGVPLVLAGRVFAYPEHLEYFQREIVPRLDGRQYRFIGPVGPERKRALLSAARCLLVSSQAPETSSLVAMEALACGTPVVAFPSGALSEIVEHEKTGFLVQSEAEMARAISAAGAIDPELCRTTAARRFSVETMIAEYFDLYRRILEPTARTQGS